MVTLEKITRQVNRLNDFFPDLGYANEKLALQNLPKGAEEWYAVPKWYKIANNYNQALENVLSLIDCLRNGSLCPYYDGRWIDLKNLKLIDKAESAIEILNIQQSSYDILIFPCQLGSYRSNQTCLDVLDNLNSWEFPLDPFSAACILLTHQDMIKKTGEFSSIVCPGAEYKRFENNRFKTAPSFVFYKDEDMVEFIDIYQDINLENNFGVATGFFHEFF